MSGEIRLQRRTKDVAAKQFDRAIELHFASVGERWDEVWLVSDEFGKENSDV